MSPEEVFDLTERLLAYSDPSDLAEELSDLSDKDVRRILRVARDRALEWKEGISIGIF